MNRVRQRGWGDSPTEQSWHWDSHWWRGSLEGNIILRPEKSHWPLMIRVFFAFYWKVFAWVWGERVDQTHQDIRRVTHTGGVNEGSLTSLTPERQFWRWFPHILHKSTWNQVSRWQHYVSGAKRAGYLWAFVRSNKRRKYVKEGFKSVLAMMSVMKANEEHRGMKTGKIHSGYQRWKKTAVSAKNYEKCNNIWLYTLCMCSLMFKSYKFNRTVLQLDLCCIYW